ncbi:putative polysaccharide biosynthesis protein [Enterococcus sp. AZ109]|uniref:putative polysaccharide biosynthesis protein n=1 Tax=Enterococcus sp. AZ109 TaxID=2774634 RepID=UPI003F684BE3
MHGAFVLTVASFVAKILSAIYRVPYQNLAGDEGFYVYQQVYPIYGIAMTLALSGLPQFISKYVAEKRGPKEQRIALTELFPLITGIGLVLWAITFFGSRQIANGMGDAELASLIRVVSFTFVVMPLLAITRGEFQGKLLMVPTAVSQVVEQLIRVAVILLAAWCFQQFHWDVYHTGTVAMVGALAGGLAAVFILQYYRKKVLSSSIPIAFFKITDCSKQLMKRLILEGGLMTIYSGYLILFQLVDSFTIKKALVDSGFSEYGAKVAKGVYDRGQPLVQLGLVVALALSSSFLPILTRYTTNHERKLFIKSSQIFLRLTCAIAAAASIGLILLLPYVNYALFKDYSGNFTLVLFVFAIFLMAMIQSYQSIAQSQSLYRSSLRAAIGGLLAKTLTTSLFAKFLGTVGASLSTLFGLLVVLAVLRRGSEEELTGYLRERNFGKKLVTCLSGMTVSIFGYYTVLQVLGNPVQHRSQALFAAVIGVIIGASIFLFLAIRLKLLTTREWLMLPMGSKILRMRRKRE